MVDFPAGFRAARRDDAAALAELVNIAGEGMPVYLWTAMAGPGQTAWDVGRERAAREAGGFSYRNAVVREVEGRVVACLVGYPLDDDPAPVDYSALPPMFVPLQELEDLAPGTWYVNVLATYPAHRGKGIGRGLLGLAEAAGREQAKRGLSIIVSDANEGARRLYERTGYRERARRTMVKARWENAGSEWVLLVKDRPGT